MIIKKISRLRKEKKRAAAEMLGFNLYQFKMHNPGVIQTLQLQSFSGGVASMIDRLTSCKKRDKSISSKLSKMTETLWCRYRAMSPRSLHLYFRSSKQAMEDNRKEVDPSGQELIEDEQSGESVRPLVADQNVNPSADEIRKAKKRAADKKYHDGQKVDEQNDPVPSRKIEDMERQSKKMRADYDELKGLHFYITGKLEQALADMEQIKEGYWSLQKVVKQQEALINMLQTPLVPGTTGFETGQLGLPVVHHQPGGPVIPESLPLLRQGGLPYPPLSGGGLTPGADLFGSHGLNYTSSPGAAMVSETLRDMNMHGDNKQLDDEERESKENGRFFKPVNTGDQNNQIVLPLAADHNDQVVQPLAADHNDQVVQPSAAEIKRAKKRARRMEYLDGKKVQQKIEDAERQMEYMKADFAGSEKELACLIGKLDQKQKDLERSTGALRLLQQKVEQQNTMINMLQQVLKGLDCKTNTLND
ncbi:hypothetical protein SADUNF_Sadunf14G0030800 [Salix dunnii]|uniref:Uncharacterized protein n=1 Tax=Salix dunnii TaxID=1413687 RepID=A0A835JDU6_9ROSI|nr:hypothetical protein SADUNF_Sadunf14G0030800 [Salix dunnii]